MSADARTLDDGVRASESERLVALVTHEGRMGGAQKLGFV
jgi:hypothetical protein